MSEARAALITGAGRGIGAALVSVFAGAGWRVHGTVREPVVSAGARVVPVGTNDRVTLHQCDLGDWESLARVADSIAEPLEIVINGAATFAGSAFRADDLNPDAMLAAFAVNVVGPTFLAKLLKDRLLRGNRRLLVMMSTGNASLSGNVDGEMLAYRASKSALNQVVRTLAAEWKSTGIVAVALNPGWVRTEMGGPDAPLSAGEAAREIFAFATEADVAGLNGAFVNTDGSSIPW